MDDKPVFAQVLQHRCNLDFNADVCIPDVLFVADW
jgi:hypothetical protein